MDDEICLLTSIVPDTVCSSGELKVISKAKVIGSHIVACFLKVLIYFLF
jgi:hypothetical protein